MTNPIRFTLVFIMMMVSACGQQVKNTNQTMGYRTLTPEEENVILHKGTEKPFTGEYENFHGKGTYHCKRCGAALYRSGDKFDSGCGWPSFDDEIRGAVKHQPDADGKRTEIICAHCGAHLGHVFTGEGFTKKDVRHCVNSISLVFVPESANPETKFTTKTNATTDKAIFAGGCFWGMDYYFAKAKGVVSVEAGYTGGHKDNPTYKEVCTGATGHAEAIQVTFNPSETSYEELARLFFEIHDPTQVGRQGPDVGDQYRSAIFYLNNDQKTIAEKLIKLLKAKGFNVTTEVTKATTFWKAEDYHQDYYDKNGHLPYCHGYVKRF